MRRPAAALFPLAAALLLWRLGASGLWESTEARYAEVAARMVRDGDWLVPRLNGLVHLDKPPLAYWASAAGMTLLGIGETGARIGLVAAALATIALVRPWAARLGGDAAATYAALALLSMPLFFALSRSVTTDLWLALAVAAAFEAARRGSRPGAGRAPRLLAWAALGVGFLAKGPVVLLWTALPALAWAAWSGGWRRLARLADPVGFALALAIALPWPLLVADRYPAALGFWLGGQTAGRMTSAYAGESAPPWTYLATIAWAAGPWLVPAALELARARRGGEGRRLLLAWVAIPLVLFSLFPTKRANYLLPLLPALAIAAGAWWAAAARGRRPGARAVVRALAATTALLGVGLAAAAGLARDLPALLRALGWLTAPAFVLGGAAAWRAAGRGRLDLAFAGLVLPLLGLYAAGWTALARPPVEAWFKVSRPLARAAAPFADEVPVVAAWDWPRAFPFYLDRRIVTVAAGRRGAIFDPDSVVRGWIEPDEAALARFVSDSGGAVFVVPRGRRARLEERLGEPVRTLAATRRHVLVTNVPPGGGRPPSAPPQE